MKKMKIFMSVLLVACLMAASLPVMAASVYETQIDFTGVTYYSDAGCTTPIAEPQNGTFYAKTTATYDGSGERTANMIAVLYNEETGKIEKISEAVTSAAWPGAASQAIVVKMTGVENITSYDFKCFAVDDFMNHTPLENGAPATPTGLAIATTQVNYEGEIVEVPITGATSATVKWNDSADDFDNVEKYEIYKNGAKVGETSYGTTQFEVKNFLRNSSNTISVRAYDGSLYSDAAVLEDVNSAEIPELIFDFRPWAEYAASNSGDFTRRLSTTGNGLVAIWQRGTSVSTFKESAVVAGRVCAIKDNGKYPGFAIADPNYITIDDNDAVLELTYLDRLPAGKTSDRLYMHAQTVNSTSATGQLPLVYDNDGNAVSLANNSVSPKIGTSDVWKTVIIKFANISFLPNGDPNANEQKKNFRIYTGTNSNIIYLASGNIYTKEDYEKKKMNPNMVVRGGGQTVYAMEFLTTGGFDVAYKIEELDGVKYVASTTEKNHELKYQVTDSVVTGAANAVLEVTFYDNQAGDTLTVCGQQIPMNNSGWRSVALDVSGATLGSEFAISRQSGAKLMLKDLQAYKK